MHGDQSSGLRDAPPPPAAISHFGEAVDRALEEIGVSAYMLDRRGRIVWMNQRAKALFGDRIGRPYTDAVTADTAPIARTAFTKKILGTQPQTHEAGFLFTRDGERVPVEIHAVAMRDNTNIVGVFGIISLKDTRRPPTAAAATKPEPAVLLTPRQQQVLQELARGSSTAQIAEKLVLSPHTIRNHVRDTLRALGTHTRLQAVLHARRRGLID